MERPHSVADPRRDLAALESDLVVAFAVQPALPRPRGAGADAPPFAAEAQRVGGSLERGALLSPG